MLAASAATLAAVGQTTEAAVLLADARAAADRQEDPADRTVLLQFYPALGRADDTGSSI